MRIATTLVTRAAECTTTELAQADALDDEISAAPKCKAFGDEELDQVSDEEFCVATKCLEAIESVVLKTPSCTEDGVSSAAFIQLLIDACSSLPTGATTTTTAPGSASNGSSTVPTARTTVAPKVNATSSTSNAATRAPAAAATALLVTSLVVAWTRVV